MWKNILMYILKLAPVAVQATEVMIGDQQSGATKKQMATDMLNAATQGALSVTTGQNAAFAQIASAMASVAIDQSVAIAKADGTLQKLTAIANAVNTGAQVAGAVTGVGGTPPNTQAAQAAPVATTPASSVGTPAVPNVPAL